MDRYNYTKRISRLIIGRNVLLGGMVILLIGGSMSCVRTISSTRSQSSDACGQLYVPIDSTEGLSIATCQTVHITMQLSEKESFWQGLERECRAKNVQVLFGSVNGHVGAWPVNSRAVAVDQSWLSKQIVTSEQAGNVLDYASSQFITYASPSRTFLIEASAGTLAVVQMASYSESDRVLQIYCHTLKRI